MHENGLLSGGKGRMTPLHSHYVASTIYQSNGVEKQRTTPSFGNRHLFPF